MSGWAGFQDVWEGAAASVGVAPSSHPPTPPPPFNFNLQRYNEMWVMSPPSTFMEASRRAATAAVGLKWGVFEGCWEQEKRVDR